MFISIHHTKIKLRSNFHTYTPLYSRKLHILVRRARTSCVTSFTILALVFGAMVENHFARRTLPDGQTVLFCFHWIIKVRKPTLSRNEKYVVDHKITQPHLSRDSSHVLSVGPSLSAPTACAPADPYGDHRAMALSFFLFTAVKIWSGGSRRFKLTMYRFWVIFFPMS